MKITDQYLEILDFKYKARLKGHVRISRARYLLLINKDLTEIEFSLYTLLYDVLVDWDSRHAEYGLFELKYPLAARYLNWKEGKVRRIFGQLINKGYIAQVSDNKYSLIGYDLQKSVHLRSDEFNYYQELKRIVDQNSKTNENS